MNETYTYNPDAWHPMVAGAVAGSIAAFMAALVSLPLRSPDEIVANSLSVVIVSIALGIVAGGLWRRLRATDNAQKVFAWSMVGGFFVAMLAATAVDLFVLSSLIPYAAPLAAIIFVTLAFFVPVLSRVTAPVWIAAAPIIIALALGLGLFGRGNVVSGDLTLDDLPDQTTTTLEGDTAANSQQDETNSGLAASYTVAGGVATYTVKEQLQGLSTQGVGTSDVVSGNVTTGGAFSFELDLQSFESNQSRRDAKVSEWFAADPSGTFSGASFELPSGATVGQTEAFPLTGTMTINGIDQDITWEIEARLEENGTISVKGETDIVLSSFDVPVVRGAVVVMEDAAHLEILVSLTPS